MTNIFQRRRVLKVNFIVFLCHISRILLDTLVKGFKLHLKCIKYLLNFNNIFTVIIKFFFLLFTTLAW